MNMRRKLEIALGVVYLAVACFLGFATVAFYRNSRDVLNANELHKFACLTRENGESFGNIASEYDVAAKKLVPSYRKTCDGLKEMADNSRSITSKLIEIANLGIPYWKDRKFHPFQSLEPPVKAIDKNLVNIESSLQSTSDALNSYETIHDNAVTILNNSSMLLSQCASQIERMEENRRNVPILLLWTSGLVALCFAFSGIVKLIAPL